MRNAPCEPNEASDELRATLSGHFAVHDADSAVAAAVEAADGGRVPVDRLFCAVLVPLLEDVGVRWRTGEIRVWEEHLESAAIRAVIEALRPRVRRAHDAVSAEHPGEPCRRALFACPPEEWHVLSLRMLADRFSMEGWDSFYLGANVPVDEIVDAARTLEVDLVVLTAATHYERLQLRDLVEGIRARLPGVRLLVGGPAFSRARVDWDTDELVDPERIPAAYA
jgi:MerR family transcriptional regulator, light-induced transcriptional regulator